jgi:DNA-binding MarR family transcriptional regulator
MTGQIIIKSKYWTCPLIVNNCYSKDQKKMTYYLLSKYIAGVYRYSKNKVNKQLAGSKLQATQIDVLLFIQEHPDYQQSQIARNMFLDASLLSRDLRELMKLGYIEREKGRWDLRKHQIRVTTAGEKVAMALKRVMTA